MDRCPCSGNGAALPLGRCWDPSPDLSLVDLRDCIEPSGKLLLTKCCTLR
jgi:hypothetical protein